MKTKKRITGKKFKIECSELIQWSKGIKWSEYTIKSCQCHSQNLNKIPICIHVLNPNSVVKYGQLFLKLHKKDAKITKNCDMLLMK